MLRSIQRASVIHPLGRNYTMKSIRMFLIRKKNRFFVRASYVLAWTNQKLFGHYEEWYVPIGAILFILMIFGIRMIDETYFKPDRESKTAQSFCGKVK